MLGNELAEIQPAARRRMVVLVVLDQLRQLGQLAQIILGHEAAEQQQYSQKEGERCTHNG